MGLLKWQNMRTYDYIEFLVHIISEICNFAIDCGVDPDQALQDISGDIMKLLQTTTYNEWKKEADDAGEDTF